MKKIAIMLLALSTLTGAVGCAGSSEPGEIDVWSTYNTVKVLQSGGEYERQPGRSGFSWPRGKRKARRLYLRRKRK